MINRCGCPWWRVREEEHLEMKTMEKLGSDNGTSNSDSGTRSTDFTNGTRDLEDSPLLPSEPVPHNNSS